MFRKTKLILGLRARDYKPSSTHLVKPMLKAFASLALTAYSLTIKTAFCFAIMDAAALRS